VETLVLLAVIAFVIAAERVPGLRFQPARVLRPHFATDLVYVATSAVGLSVVMRTAAHRGAQSLGTLVPDLAAWPAPLALIAAVVLYDASAYAVHLLLHRSGFGWRLHKVHHSSRQLDWLATFRGHALEHGLRHLASSVALVFAGFPVAIVAAAAAIYTAFAVLNHSNLRVDLRRLEHVFITPRLHRLHHVTSSCERNLGTIFTWWDRLRGTLLTDPDAPTEPLGVPGEVESYPQAWLPQLVEPFRAPRRLALASTRTGAAALASPSGRMRGPER
jgi:lathosterol oxidase